MVFVFELSNCWEEKGERGKRRTSEKASLPYREFAYPELFKEGIADEEFWGPSVQMATH